jgi:hypothetical protein
MKMLDAKYQVYFLHFVKFEPSRFGKPERQVYFLRFSNVRFEPNKIKNYTNKVNSAIDSTSANPSSA